MPDSSLSVDAASRSTPPPHGHTPVPDTSAPGSVRTLHLAIAALPAAAMALLAAGVVAFLLGAGPVDRTSVAVLMGAAAAAVLVVVAAAIAAERASRQVHRRLDAIRSASAQGRSYLHQLVGRLRDGERFDPRPAPDVVAADSDPFTLLAYERAWEQYAAETAILEAADLRRAHVSEQQVEVFVNVARRMQSLVHREITLLDELESQVEDPDLLKGLFTIDHLATRMRRQSESLAVLGGAASRRQWTRPVSLYEVLRSAVAEVEHYSRVKVVPPVSGTLSGSAVVDVIHLIAELIENATKFSPPHSQVMLRAEEVPAGLAIDIEDRGLGVPHEDLRRMNSLLSTPGGIDVAEMLRDGRIGLFVVSTLAHKHGVKVQLQRNVYGGTQAVVLLPNELLPSRPLDREDAPVQAAAEAERPRLPTRSTAPGGDQGQVRPSPPPSPFSSRSPSVAAPELQDQGAQQQESRHQMPQRRTPQGERPPLPERRAQTHLAPQLRDIPTPDRRAREVDHTPGLMAAFQSGFHRAEKDSEDGPSRSGDSIG